MIGAGITNTECEDVGTDLHSSGTMTSNKEILVKRYWRPESEVLEEQSKLSPGSLQSRAGLREKGPNRSGAPVSRPLHSRRGTSMSYSSSMPRFVCRLTTGGLV